MFTIPAHRIVALSLASVVVTAGAATAHPPIEPGGHLHPQPKHAVDYSTHAISDQLDHDPALLVTISARERKTITRLNELLAKSPDDTIALSRLGATWLRIARHAADHHAYRAAEDAFAKLHELIPDSVNALIGLAYARSGYHEFSAALDAARLAATREPGRTDVLALLGDLHFALGHTQEAEILFDRIADAELTLNSLSRRALMQQYRSSFDAARRTFEEAIRAGELLDEPDESVAWCWTMLGDLEYNLGRLDAAVEAYRRAVALDEFAVAAMLQLAKINILNGEFEAAHATLRTLLERNNRDPSIWIALGDLELARGNITDADDSYEYAAVHMEADLARNELAHTRDLVELWVSRGEHLDHAVALARRELDDVRQDADGYITLAWALLKQGDAAAALPIAREALARSTASTRSLYRAGLIYHAANRTNDARIILTTALQRNDRTEPELVKRARTILKDQGAAESVAPRAQ